MIIIFTSEFDYSTSKIMRWLDYFGQKVTRINVDDKIHKLVEIEEKKIVLLNTKTKTNINLLEAQSCWWRRKGIDKNTFIQTTDRINENQNTYLSKILSNEQNIVSGESKRLIEYIYYKIYNNCNINLGNPNFDLNRLIMFEMAKDVGLTIPQYKIISNSSQINIGKNKDIVTKPINECINNIIDERRFHTYTEILPKDFFFKKNEINLFPSLISEKIDKKFEIRSFYIEGNFFSMAIFSQKDDQTKIDFRKYNLTKPNRMEAFELPSYIKKKLQKIFRRIKLNTGSIDLILDKDDNYVFLEINPVGQFGMVEISCNYQLDKKVANYLTYGHINGN